MTDLPCVCFPGPSIFHEPVGWVVDGAGAAAINGFNGGADALFSGVLSGGFCASRTGGFDTGLEATVCPGVCGEAPVAVVAGLAPGFWAAAVWLV